MEEQTAADIIARIQEMQALSEVRRTTGKPPAEKLHNKMEWMDRWLPMKITHQQVVAMREAAYEFCMAYAKAPSRGSRLLIYGENGAGKSRIAKKTFGWAARCAGLMPRVERSSEYSSDGAGSPRAEYHHFPTLVREMMKDFKIDWIDRLCSRPDAPNLLVLDDIGAEHDPSKYGATQLYLILERRSDMWTLLTTNAAPDSWEEKWDRRVASRLVRNCNHVCVDQVPDFSTV